MITLWGEVPEQDTKICRDCEVEQPITQFEINRKFYRADLKEKHRVLRRPSCRTCRSKKKSPDNSLKSNYPRPKSLDCPLCYDTVEGSQARLDHDPNTGEIRGWLCNNCNTALGKMKEDPEVLWRAIKWISTKKSNHL